MKKIILSLLMCSSVCQAEDTFNFRFSPVHALIGYVNINLDVAVSSSWTLGPSVGIWNFDSSSLSTTSNTTNYKYQTFLLGGRANWFANGVYKDGLFVGPHFEFLNMTAKSTSNVNDQSGKATATILGCYVGYGWFWNSFNQMLSGGIRTASDTKIKIEDSNGSTVDESKSTSFTGFAIEYTLGWTF